MKPSNLVEKSWGNMSYSRYISGDCEVLATVYGPYESRNSQKSDFKRCNVEVVVSDINTTPDHSSYEKILSDLYSAVIATDQYPYLSVMICFQVFSKDSNILSTLVNAGCQAISRSNLQVKHKAISQDFCDEEHKLTLALVPGTDFILMSLADQTMDFEFYKECVRTLSQLPEIST